MKDKTTITIDPNDVDESIEQGKGVKNDVNDLMVQEEQAIASLYGGNIANAGTEDVTSNDLNIPTLKLIQDSTKDLEDKHVGYFYRSDTKEQLPFVECNLVAVISQEVDNYNKTGKEVQKVYFGYFKDTKEAFRMYVRGWSLDTHRKFQSEVLTYKNRLGVPMFALSVKLMSDRRIGKNKVGIDYDVKCIDFRIVKKENDASKPVVETNPDRVAFLYEAVDKFKQAAATLPQEEEAEA